MEHQFEQEYLAGVVRPGLEALKGTESCEQSAVKNTVLSDANNLGLNLSGYDIQGATATVAGFNGQGMTELYVNVETGVNPATAFKNLVDSLGANFSYAGTDALHPGYSKSYRQNVGTWSMQISYSDSGNLQIDIDPHNPMGGLSNLAGHAMDVMWNTITGGDTNYHSAAGKLGIQDTPCN
jgi:hypothetical protein